MTSLRTALRPPTTGRFLVATSLAALTAVVTLTVVTAPGAKAPSERPVRGPSPSAPAGAAMARAVSGSVRDDGRASDAVSRNPPRTSAADSDGVARGSAGPRWLWPVQPRPPVIRAYRAPLTTFGPGHRGLDLGAPLHAQVRAVEAGVVTHAGAVAGRGTVTVTHADGLRSTYEPVQVTVARGAPVATGQVLGTLDLGGGHCGGRGCLHLGARRGHAYLDPLPLLVGGRLALLPVGRAG